SGLGDAQARGILEPLCALVGEGELVEIVERIAQVRPIYSGQGELEGRGRTKEREQPERGKEHVSKHVSHISLLCDLIRVRVINARTDQIVGHTKSGERSGRAAD